MRNFLDHIVRADGNSNFGMVQPWHGEVTNVLRADGYATAELTGGTSASAYQRAPFSHGNTTSGKADFENNHFYVD